MRKPESSTPVDTMDYTATSAESKPKLQGELNCGGDNDDTTDDADEDCDMEVLYKLSNSFRQAQAALDENRSLIDQVKENHQSMIPENLAKNVALISEINRNVFKVISVYSDLSANFSKLVQERRRIDSGNSLGRAGSEVKLKSRKVFGSEPIISFPNMKLK